MSVFDTSPFDRPYPWDLGNLGATRARMIHSARPVLSNIPSPMLPATYQIILIIWISVSSRASPTGDVLRLIHGW
jgi:hypothetical protein